MDEACDARGVLLDAYLGLEAARAALDEAARHHRLTQARDWLEEHVRSAGDDTARPDAPACSPVLDPLRRAVLGTPAEPSNAAPQPVTAARMARAHRLYQGADYDAAAQCLPGMIIAMGRVRAAVPVRSATYLAAARLANKLGDPALAWIAADRGLQLAEETRRPGLIGTSGCEVACALLSNGHVRDAERTATRYAERVASAGDGSPDSVAVLGALRLLLAVIAARQGHHAAARKALRTASDLAKGPDGNRMWTAFGPTNVRIHEVSVYVELGDVRQACDAGRGLDTDRLPTELRGRRSQVHLDLGGAATGRGDDGLAVLHLLEAERIAPQSVSRNVQARAVLVTLLGRERRGATPGLRELARRAEVS